VALRASPAELAQLETLHAQLEGQAHDRDAFFATNERFHMALLHLAGNRWTVQTVQDLRKVMKLNRHHSLFKQGRLEESLAEHRALMQALLAHDSAAAVRLMRTHFDNGLQAAG
jgi:DNA-binding GntR family transcriptional regulator